MGTLKRAIQIGGELFTSQEDLEWLSERFDYDMSHVGSALVEWESDVTRVWVSEADEPMIDTLFECIFEEYQS